MPDLDTGTFILLVVGVAALIIILIFVTIFTRRGKAEPKKVVRSDILADELDRHKRENYHLKAELKRINSLNNLFFASMIRLTARLNPEEIANETAGLLSNYLESNELAVFLYDEKGKRLNIVAERGIDDNWIPKIVYKLGDGKVGLAAEKRLPIGSREFDFLGTNKEPFDVFVPNICYPMLYQDKLLGVIAICRSSDFDEREKNLLGVVSTMTAVALNNTRSFESISFSASIDPLTKLYNIGYFKDRLQEELARARRFQHSVSITIIDLDKFKDYNDSLGHQAGDQLLIRLAKIFKDHFEDTDIIARYGGDEFVIMCPEIRKQDTARIVGNLLNDLEMYDFSRGESAKKVTFSAGVAAFPDDGGTVSELIKSADEALYEAKGMGRNTVRIRYPKVEKI
ncbi:MAG: sensor domain-containing diguanylate cyclase [candidate division WOR-3 bacterium]|nr:MAG: sensor domain-containing diguanylate cyclase [candidate division WOR-3 bacterium]